MGGMGRVGFVGARRSGFRARILPRRVVRAVAVALFFVLGSVAATGSADAAALPQATLKFSSVKAFVKSLLADTVGLPRQVSGSAAGKGGEVSAASTRAGKGTGHAPGKGVGELAAYDPAGRKAAQGQSGAARAGFNARTSTRDAVKSTAFSDYYHNADGSYTVKTSQAPVNYKAADGSWVPVDAALVKGSDGRWHQKADGIGISFAAGRASAAAADGLASAASTSSAAQADSGSSGDLVSVSLKAGESVAWSLAGAAAVVPSVTGDTATYGGILTDTDLVLTSNAAGVKESLILSSASAPNSWTFPLSLTGVSVYDDPSSGWELRDSSGAVVGRLPAPFAYDSTPLGGSVQQRVETQDVTYALTTDASGAQSLVMTLDAAWLDDPARVFPVTVDPTVTVGDAGVLASTYLMTKSDHSCCSNVNYSSEGDLKVGFDGFTSPAITARSFIKFDTMPAYSGYHVTQANLGIFDIWASTCTAEPFDVYPITSSWLPTDRMTWVGSTYTGPQYSGTSMGEVTTAPGAACTNSSGVVTTGTWMLPQLNTSVVNQWTSTAPDSYQGVAVVAPSESNELEWKVFDSTLVTSNSPYIFITYTPDSAPQINSTAPASGYNSSTLTPTLQVASASDADNWPGQGLGYEYKVFDGANDQLVADSQAGTARCGNNITLSAGSSWTVPAGKLKWGQSYYWSVVACDKYLQSTWATSAVLVTTIPPPLLTSSLSQNSSGHGFDPGIGNYTTSATDAQVTGIGPQLQITRDYNSLDPRSTQALGAGWSSILDARATEQYDASGANVLSVTVTYPDGSQVGYGKNADGSFSPPLGRFASFNAVTGGYSLTDKNDTVYAFTQSLGSGVYGLTSITDAALRRLTLNWVSGQITSLTAASGRALHIAWSTPAGASVAHVATIATDPVASGGTSAALTWTYHYSRDQLASVCPPTSATACTGYQYTSGSQYRTAQLDGAPAAYWPLSESSYGSSGTALDQVLANEHTKDASYTSSVGFGASGPLSGSGSTAVTLDGTSGAVSLPANMVKGQSYVSVSLWFKTTGSGILFATGSDPVGTAAPGSGAMPVLYVGTDGKLYGHFWNNNVTGIVSSGAVNDGNWHQAVLSGAATTQSLYLDGALVGSKSGTLTNVDTDAFVGDGVLNSNAWAATPSRSGNMWWHLAGSVSDVSVYDSALPASTVAGLHTAGVTSTSLLKQITRPSGAVAAQIQYSPVTGRVTQVTDANGHAWQVGAPTVSGSAEGYRAAVLGSAPSGYWRLGDYAGASTAYDEVAADSTAMTYNNATLGASGPLNSSQSAATFNGTSSYAATGTSVVDTSKSFSVSAWADLASTSGWSDVVAQDGTQATGFELQYDVTDSAWAFSRTATDAANAGGTKVHGSSKPSTGTWYHLVGVYDVSDHSMKLYVNGVLVGTGTDSTPYASTGGLTIGRGKYNGSATSFFNGSIAEVAVYPSALSGADVAAEYAAAKNASSLNPTVTVKVADPSTALAPIAMNGTTYSASANQTWTGRTTRLVFQSTGNLVIQRVDTGGTLWASGTSGYPSATLAFQADGNLVIYNGGTPLWASGTNYNPGNTAVLLGDGDLVIDNSGGAQLWESGTTIPGGAGVLIYEYDPVNGDRPIAQYDGTGAKTTYGYDSSGFLHTVVDPDGNETITGHDPRGNTVSQTTCQVQSTNTCSTSYYTYSPDDTSTQLNAADPSNDLLLTSSDPRSSGLSDSTYRTTYAYDAKGNRTAVTTPPVAGYPSGRKATDVYSDGTMTYPAADNAAKPVPAGLPVTSTSAGGAVTTLKYYANGDVYSTTDPVGTVTAYTYDSLGRTLSKAVTYATGSGSTTNVLTSTYVYDGLGRLVTSTQPAVTDRITGAVHTASTVDVYDVDGNRTSETVSDTTGGDAPRTTLNHYNASDQLDWSMDAQQYIDSGGVANPADETQYTYDSYGNKASMTDAAGNVTTYTYDADDRLTYTTLKNYTGSPAGSQSAADLVEQSKAYDPAGRLASVTDAMGYATLYKYTDNGLTAQTTRCSAMTITNGTPTCTGSSYVEAAYTYDAAGNAVKQVANNGALETDYVYDAAGRKTSTTVDPSGLSRTTTVNYGADDFILSQRTGDAHGSATTDYTYSPTGVMTSQSVENYTTGAPTGWWKLNDGAAGASTPTTAHDSSGNGYTGTLNSGVTWASGAASFNGSSGSVTTAGTPINTASSYTVSAWVNLAATPTTYTTLVGAPGVHVGAFYLQYSVSAGGWAFVTTSADSASETQATSHLTATPAANTWYHLVGVYNASAGTVQLYVNGAPAAAVTQTSAWAASQGLSIGSSGASNYVNGQVANVQVYPRALAQSDVNTLYANGSGRTSLSAVSAASNTTGWTLDGRGLPVSVTDADQKTTTYVYDEAGRRAITQEPAVTTGAYSPSTGYTTSSPSIPTTTTGYDTFGETAESKDPTGIQTNTSYDADGRPVKSTLPDYQQPGSSYHSLLTGQASKAQYNELGESTATWDPANVQSTYSYDQLGHQTSSTSDPSGLNRTTTTAYDADGDTLRSTDPAGAIQSATYDYLGRTATSTQVLGIGGSGSTQIPTGCSTYNNVATQAACTSTYAYTDTAGFLSQSTSQRAVSTAYGYDAAGERTSVTDAASQTTSTAYDYAGRAVKTTAPDSTYTTATYNQAGLQTGAAQYDSSNNLLRSTSAVYDGNGNTLSTTDANGNTTQFSYDDDNRLSSETQPASYSSTLSQVPSVTQNITTPFGYDAAGRRTKYVTGNANVTGTGNTWYTTYNSRGLPESTVEPATTAYATAANSTSTITYDADARPVEQDAPGGVVQTQSYDNAGDTLTQSGSGADAPTATRTFSYYNNGLVHTAATSNTSSGTSNATSDTFSYDDSGALAATSGSSGSSAFTYNADGQMASRADTVGTSTYTTGYGYDTAGRLSNIAEPLTGTTLSYAYTANSLDHTVTYGTGGDVRTYHYNTAHELASDTLKSGSTTIASIAYGYDANGNEMSKTTVGFTAAAANTYTYDQANRLKSWSNGATVTGYSYDQDGNRTQAGANVFTYDARDEITSDGTNTYAYTARGTLQSTTSAAAGTVTSAVDSYGQQTAAGSTADTYDALGRVTAVGGAAMAYSGTGNQVVSDTATSLYTRDPSGAIVAVKLTPASPGTLAFIDQHTDLVGSFTPTATSALTTSVAYDPLGAVLSTSGTQVALGYQSEYTSGGKVDMAARWYNPATGQFTSKDTVANNPVPNSANANPFAYGDDDPMTAADPTGHCPTDICGGGYKRPGSNGTYIKYDPKATNTELAHSAPSPIVGAYSSIVADRCGDRYGCWLSRMRALGSVKTGKDGHTITGDPGVVADLTAAAATLAPPPQRANCGWNPSSWFGCAKNFAADHPAVAGLIAGVASFAVCAGVSVLVTGGVAMGGCGVVAAAASSMVTHWGQCSNGSASNCDALSYAESGAIGGVTALATMGVASAVSPLLGDAVGTGLATKVLSGAVTGAISGGVGGGLNGALNYAMDCGSTDQGCSFSGFGNAVTSGINTGIAVGGAVGGILPIAGAGLARIAPDLNPGSLSNQISCDAIGSAVSAMPHSFVGSTRVLMADGATKPIDQITVGDQIADAVPGQSGTQSNTVTAVIVTKTDHDFVNVGITPVTAAAAKATASKPSTLKKAAVGLAAALTAATFTATHSAAGAPADRTAGSANKATSASRASATGDAIEHAGTLTTTFHHPFYDITQAAFVDAQNLKPGDVLQTPTGTAEVTTVHLFHANTVTYDLTIGDLHTYYVVAGSTPVLVHNCGYGNARFAVDSQGTATDIRAPGNDLPGTASIKDDRLAHIEYRHGPGAQEQAIAAGERDLPGEFGEDFIWNASDDNVLGRNLIDGANGSPELPNPNGPGHLHQFDYGRTIGVNGAGQETSVAEIVVRDGRIWTAYPK